MPTPYADCAENVKRLHQAVGDLERECAILQLAPLAEREWYELLTQKLLPQLSADAFLVTAVVGGTNIGKSVVFNHLAGCRASSTSPLASGTKHPVCLTPPGFEDRHDLPAIFPGFILSEWSDSDAALMEDDQDRLFWRESPDTPENLLVLDTPDIDSDARINWHRADSIRRCADVLIAVLTQQKYNDAAVKQFFRQAADEDKAVVVIFNQCQLPDDEAYWPLWLETFCRETGIQPEWLYLAPNDRAAAESRSLPFYERTWPIEADANAESAAVTASQNNEPRDLAADLSRLRFGEFKLRSLRGSLRHVANANVGVPAFLREVEQRSASFRAAADYLAAHNLAEIEDWPPVPNNVLVAAIRRWWQSDREGWTAKVHGFYNSVGQGLFMPVHFVRRFMGQETTAPLDAYRRQEWNAILRTVDKVYKNLEQFSETGNELLQPRLKQLLGGTSRSAVIAKLQECHQNCNLEMELNELVHKELQSFRDQSPHYYRQFKRLDAAAAAFRPATSIVLFMTGFGPAGDAAAQMVANTAIQSVVHVAGDVAGGTVAAAVGETAISSTASSGAGFLEAKFHRLHSAFVSRRADWLGRLLKEHLLGSLPDDLQKAAEIPNSEPFQRIETELQRLTERLKQDASEEVATTQPNL